MTVKELKEELDEMPEEAEVVIENDSDLYEYDYITNVVQRKNGIIMITKS